MPTLRRALSILAAASLASACGRAPRAEPTSSHAPAASLREAFRGAFMVGAALNPAQFGGRDARGAAIVADQFNTVTPENALKWRLVHPRPGRYDFAAADRYVAFGERHGMFVVGHTLVWHSQVPRWVFEGADGRPVSRDTLVGRMRDHIATVVGRYRGRVKGWDVVNEALNDDGTLRDSPWRRIIGDDYVALAFRFAHEADPGAELYYNDYSLEDAPKRAGAVRLIRDLRARGIPVTAVGTQEHVRMEWPTAAQVDSTIAALAATGVRVNVTELDVDVLPPAVRGTGADVSTRVRATPATNPYVAGLPDSLQLALARRYAELFRVYLRHRDVIDRVTFWGVRDGDSWLNNWPARGRTSYPLPFDRQGRPKPAFDSIVAVAHERPPEKLVSP